MDYKVGIVLIAMTAEAHINYIGMTCLNPAVWKAVDRGCGLIDKWLTVAEILGNRPVFSRDEEPLKTLHGLVKLRNEFVHSKPEWYCTDFSSHPPEHSETTKEIRYEDCVGYVKSFVEATKILSSLHGEKAPGWLLEHSAGITGDQFYGWLDDEEAEGVSPK